MHLNTHSQDTIIKCHHMSFWSWIDQVCFAVGRGSLFGLHLHVKTTTEIVQNSSQINNYWNLITSKYLGGHLHIFCTILLSHTLFKYMHCLIPCQRNVGFFEGFLEQCRSPESPRVQTDLKRLSTTFYTDIFIVVVIRH